MYDAGYDYASGLVHPVSMDGHSDYLRLMGRKTEVPDEGKDVLVRNGQVVVTMHLQQFLNEPELNWREVLYDLVAPAAGGVLYWDGGIGGMQIVGQ